MMLSNRGWLLAHGALVLAVIAPFVAVANLPLVDLPNHISRIAILSGLPQSAALQKFYFYEWHFVPNLAFDIFTFFLGRLVGVVTAAKLFCATAAAVLYIGTVLLHRALQGRFSAAPMAAAVLVFNGAFLFGFVNYVLGVGLSLCAVAAWVTWRDLPRRIHAVLFGAIGLALMSVHLYGYGLFAVTVLGIEADRVFRGWRRGARLSSLALDSLLAGAAPALAVVLFFAISPTEAGIDRDVPSTFYWKAEALAEPLLFYFSLPELLIAFGFCAVFAVFLLLRIAVLNSRMVIALALLLLVFLAMPRTALSSGYADYRMPAAIALFALASLDWNPGASRASVARGSAAIVALSIGKIAMITAAWISWQPALGAYSSAFEKLPAGAVVFPVEGTTGSTARGRRPPISQMVTMAAPRGVFVPILFGDEPGFLLHFKPPYRELKRPYIAIRWKDGRWAEVLRRFSSSYTYLLVDRPEFVHIPPDIICPEVASGPTFILCKLAPRS